MALFESSSNKGKEVKRLSKVTEKPLDKPFFSTRPNTSLAPWPRPVFDSLVSAPQYGSALNKYPSVEARHHNLKPNRIESPHMNCLAPCFPKYGIMVSSML